MMDQLQTARLAMALNDVAAALQQLAVVIHHSGPTPPAKQLAELRAQLAEPPASVAEPECGCSLYSRCAAHNVDKRCRCNGPDFPSSACLHPEHRTAAALRPHADPARLD